MTVKIKEMQTILREAINQTVSIAGYRLKLKTSAPEK